MVVDGKSTGCQGDLQTEINLPAPRGGVLPASRHSVLRTAVQIDAASGGECTPSNSLSPPTSDKLEVLASRVTLPDADLTALSFEQVTHQGRTAQGARR